MQQKNITDLDVQAQQTLAQQAAKGEEVARRQVNELLAPVITYQTARFCKRFCRQNKFTYSCTLNPPVAQAANRSMQSIGLCEWGNASYGWMLNELCSSKRLLKYEGRNGAGLFAYLYQIANSLPFYERWKDWRFGRHIHVPTYIQVLSPNAGRVFMLLRSNESMEDIAQTLSLSLDETEALSQQIIILLTQKRKLYLLNPPVNVSLTDAAGGESSAHQKDLADYDETAEDQQQKIHLSHAWQKLESLEQYIIEALVIEEQDAKYVLQALIKMDVSIKHGVAAKDTSVQQLYYFRRKTLAKLAEIMK